MSDKSVFSVNEYLTPYKYKKPVLIGSGVMGSFDENAIDAPFVFRHNDKFYMMYIGFNGTGYQTALATSDDLLNWEPQGLILGRGEGNIWDSRNTAGCWILKENKLDSPPALKKYQNKYWLAYHAYPGDGYEVGPGRIGLAWTDDESLMKWNRLPDPILLPEDGTDWENGGLYKESLVEHDGQFYLFYNAKNRTRKENEVWTEQIGLAVSTDLMNWTRHGNNPVLRVTAGWDSLFVSDPCIVQHGGKWLMFYFGFNGIQAQEGIAYSRDLLQWNKYPKPIITVGEQGSFDSTFAHKPSVIMHNHVLYHFYCSVRPSQAGDRTRNGNEFRTISVATSVPLE